MTKQNTQPLSARILRHIADLHEAGIIADDAKTTEEWGEWQKSREPIEGADFCIACTSYNAFDMANRNDIDFPAAIAKNERRLAWMRQHPDPTKTPLELWEEAKRAEEESNA